MNKYKELFRWLMGLPETMPTDIYRVADATILADGVYSGQEQLGVLEDVQPTLEDMRISSRGLFFTLLDIRANAVARAIVGNASSDGFSVQYVDENGDYKSVDANSPWLQLLRCPNPYRSSFQVWKWAMQARDLRGYADFIVQDDIFGMPIALFEVYPAFGTMSPKPNGYGGVAGWHYRRADGVAIDLEARDVIRLGRASGWSPYQHVSLLESGALELETDLYLSLYRREVSESGNTPPIYLKTDQSLSPEEAEQHGIRFRNKYMSPGQVKGVPVLGKGATANKLGMSPDDMLAIESQDLTDKHLYWICKIPQGMLTDEANRSNAEQAERTMSVIMVQPEADMIAAQLTTGFEFSFGSDKGALRIVAPNTTPVNRLELVKIQEVELRSGKTLNEIRVSRGDDPVEDGDVVRLPGGLRPIGNDMLS